MRSAGATHKRFAHAAARAEELRAGGCDQDDLFERLATEALARKEEERSNRCRRCWHDAATKCICSQLAPLRLAVNARVCILMHHKEFLSAGDDAKLLTAMLPPEQARVFVYGRRADWDALAAELAADPQHTMLLWPGEGALTVGEFVERRLPQSSPWRRVAAGGRGEAEGEAEASRPLMRVVVLDGVYNHARSMFRALRRRHQGAGHATSSRRPPGAAREEACIGAFLRPTSLPTSRCTRPASPSTSAPPKGASALLPPARPSAPRPSSR